MDSNDMSRNRRTGMGYVCGNYYCMAHVVQKGDTLYLLSKKYGVKLSALMMANPFVDVYNLRIGDELCIPKLRPQVKETPMPAPRIPMPDMSMPDMQMPMPDMQPAPETQMPVSEPLMPRPQMPMPQSQMPMPQMMPPSAPPQMQMPMSDEEQLVTEVEMKIQMESEEYLKQQILNEQNMLARAPYHGIEYVKADDTY